MTINAFHKPSVRVHHFFDAADGAGFEQKRQENVAQSHARGVGHAGRNVGYAIMNNTVMLVGRIFVARHARSLEVAALIDGHVDNEGFRFHAAHGFLRNHNRTNTIVAPEGTNHHIGPFNGFRHGFGVDDSRVNRLTYGVFKPL